MLTYLNVFNSYPLIFWLFYFDRPLISNELKELIERMLDKNPETRITIPEIKVRRKIYHIYILESQKQHQL